jgi:hypothetical protein
MTTTARTVLGWTFAATISLLLGLGLFAIWNGRGASSVEGLEYSKLYLETFKVIVVSFFVALIGILVPARLREVRYNFQRMKESRVAYSEAKTGVAYLPIQLCSLNFAEAAALAQRVHFHKHQAELYHDELKAYAQHLGVSPEEWGKKLYDRLKVFRSVLEDHVADWDSLPRNERIKVLLEARSQDHKAQELTKTGDIID